MNREAKRRTLRKYSPPKRAQKESSIEISPHEGKVLIRFPEVVRTASFTPEQAMGLAQVLFKMAAEINTWVKCECGRYINDENIDFANSCNELGEEYYYGTAECQCGKEYEWSGWGECEDMNQAKEDLKDHIDSNAQ